MRQASGVALALVWAVALAGLALVAQTMLQLPLAQPGEQFDVRSGRQSGGPALFSRMIFVLIDGLRADMAQSGLPVLGELVRAGHAHVHVARAGPPTVTLARLKALVTGAPPSFGDVLRNLDSAALGSDSLLHRLASDGAMRLALYGDDTWLRLFPHLFADSDGTTSFFVSDSVHVDANVSRHLAHVAAGLDSRGLAVHVAVLHYLGLDHIGHVQGPRSALARAKLAQMDEVVRNLSRGLAADTLLVLCSDHGMTDDGNHGGASAHETQAVLALITSRALAPSPPLSLLDLRANGARGVRQEDVAVALAECLGVAAPGGAMGTLAPLRSWFGALNETHARLAPRLHANARALLAALRGLLAADDAVLGALEAQLADLRDQASQAAGSAGEGAVLDELCRWLERASDVCIDAAARIDTPRCVAGATLVSLAAALALAQAWPAWQLSAPVAALVLARVCALLATSYIEEEHQLWYFALASSALVAMAAPGRAHVLSGAALLALGRAARAWNQTGDKWRAEKDLSDALYGGCSAAGLAAAALAGAVAACWLARTGTRDALGVASEWCCAACTALCVGLKALQHGAGDGVGQAGGVLADAHVSLVRVTLVLLLASTLGRLARERRRTPPVGFAFVCWLCLLHRPHNTLVLALHMAMVVVLRRAHACSCSPLAGVRAACVGAAFFHYGGSNSLATIDLAGAYTGLSAYWPTVVAVQGLALAFGGSALFAADRAAVCERCAASEQTERAWQHLVPAAAGCWVVIAMRHHLFVWSVFVPKLVYVCLWTAFEATLAGVALAGRMWAWGQDVAHDAKRTN